MKTRAFSLIELLVIIAISVLLLAILIPVGVKKNTAPPSASFSAPVGKVYENREGDEKALWVKGPQPVTNMDVLLNALWATASPTNFIERTSIVFTNGTLSLYYRGGFDPWLTITPKTNNTWWSPSTVTITSAEPPVVEYTNGNWVITFPPSKFIMVNSNGVNHPYELEQIQNGRVVARFPVQQGTN